jgi:hypothetical protein
MDRAISTDHQGYGMWTPAFEQLHEAVLDRGEHRGDPPA